MHLIENSRPPNLVKTKKLTLNNVKYIKSLTIEQKFCDIGKTMDVIGNSAKAKWNIVEILGDVKIINTNSEFINILQNVVTTTSSNVVSSSVCSNPIPFLK